MSDTVNTISTDQSALQLVHNNVDGKIEPYSEKDFDTIRSYGNDTNDVSSFDEQLLLSTKFKEIQDDMQEPVMKIVDSARDVAQMNQPRGILQKLFLRSKNEIDDFIKKSNNMSALLNNAQNDLNNQIIKTNETINNLNTRVEENKKSIAQLGYDIYTLKNVQQAVSNQKFDDDDSEATRQDYLSEIDNKLNQLLNKMETCKVSLSKSITTARAAKNLQHRLEYSSKEIIANIKEELVDDINNEVILKGAIMADNLDKAYKSIQSASDDNYVTAMDKMGKNANKPISSYEDVQDRKRKIIKAVEKYNDDFMANNQKIKLDNEKFIEDNKKLIDNSVDILGNKVSHNIDEYVDDNGRIDMEKINSIKDGIKE